MQHKLVKTILLTLLSFSITANGQKLVNSPYSRFNIGAIDQAGSFRSLGMGGVGTAMRDNSSLYYTNPASYSSLDTNSFIFDFGIDYSQNKLDNGVTSYKSDDVNFDHLIMGFPLAKGIGVGIGLIPLSNGYFKLSESVLKTNPGYNTVTGEYVSYHAGEGSLTNFFIGTGVKITKNISAGINMTVLFGQLNRLNQFDFADYYNVFNSTSTEKLQLGGVNFDYGLQYTGSFKNNYFLNAGISLNSGNNYNSTYEHFSSRNSAYGTTDTITYVSDDITKAFIPGTLRAGVAFGKKNKFTAGIDYVTTKWSTSKIPGALNPKYAADTKSVLFGLEYIPDRFSNYNFMKRMEYRVGGHVGDNYLIILGEQLKEYGVTAGIGIPLKRSLSKTNLFFDFTRKAGPSGSTLPTENYYTVGISLNLYDWWFIQRKYE